MLGVVACGLGAVTFALHPRAALPAIVVCALLHFARCSRLAAVLLVVLMIAALAASESTPPRRRCHESSDDAARG